MDGASDVPDASSVDALARNQAFSPTRRPTEHPATHGVEDAFSRAETERSVVLALFVALAESTFYDARPGEYAAFRFYSRAMAASKRVCVADCAICLDDGSNGDGDSDGDDSDSGTDEEGDDGSDDDSGPTIEEVGPSDDEEEEDDTNGLELPCGHAFHAACVRRWLQTHTTCPLCRADVM